MPPEPPQPTVRIASAIDIPTPVAASPIRPPLLLRRTSFLDPIVISPPKQLRFAIHLGVPTGPDDDESRLLYELDAFTGTSPVFGVLTSSYFDRQALLYESILDAGAREGQFTLAASAKALARGLVALEDGLGLQVVIGHPSIDSEEAERILLRHATIATGFDLVRELPGSSR